MSFTDRLMLWFHVAFVIFTIGPVTLATMSSPRAIRSRNAGLLRYLLWITRIFGAASLGVFAFGVVLGQSLNELGKAWLTVSMTLFVVAIVLLILIMRDQRRALAALERAAGTIATGPSAADKEQGQAAPATGAGDLESGTEAAAPATAAEPTATGPGEAGPADGGSAHPEPAGTASRPEPVATVERGRIVSMAGIVSLIWLAILVLMVWNS